jgi:glycosyltransferase involved in cell wall biosynthesis
VRAAGKLPEGDIVVTNDFWMPIFAARRKKKSGKVVINANRFPKGQYGLYGGADLIAAASGAVASEIRRQTPNLSGRIKVIPNAIDECFLEEGVAGGESRVAGKSQKTVLYVGRIHPEKGLDVLLEAWKRVGEMKMKRDVKLKIVGPYKKEQGGGGQEYLKSLKGKAEGVGWGEPVFGAEELAKVYDTGDILVYPSQAELGEALPLAPLEGMARGLPVVVSNLEVFKEYLEEGRNGWTFNHRESAVENLAAVLGSALSADLRTMGQEARRTAERFSVQKIADMYLEVFKEIFERK